MPCHSGSLGPCLGVGSPSLEGPCPRALASPPLTLQLLLQLLHPDFELLYSPQHSWSRPSSASTSPGACNWGRLLS